MRPPHLKTAAELAEDKPHGTRIKYLGGCRCKDCRAANTKYELDRHALACRNRGNPLVPADPARRHLFTLSLRGIGWRTVEKISGVSHGVLKLIKSGSRRQIRRKTEQKILAVKVTVNSRIQRWS